MAKKSTGYDPNIVDYYVMYGLKRGEDRKKLLRQLRRKQGEIKQMMSAGALNNESKMSILIEQDKQITAAIRVFKSQEALDDYNAQLDAAYEHGAVDTAAQEAAMAALEEIERMFVRGNFAAVIKMCKSALKEQGANEKMYNWLAQSYYMCDQGAEALNTVDEFNRNFPNNINAMDLGVRYNILIDDNVAKAQEYANLIAETFADSYVAIADQVYIHLAQKNTDMAFREIDKYIDAHPSDDDFRQVVAYDIVGFCSRMYKMSEHDGEELAYLTSAEDYAYCKKLTDKAKTIYNDSDIQDFCDYNDQMGEIEFNRDNLTNIKWLGIGAAIYGMAFAMTISLGDSQLFTTRLIALACTVICICIGIKLYQVSKRPYWQIYKYEVTGEREREEKIYIIIGNVISGYLRISFKLAMKIFKAVLYLINIAG